MTLKNYAGHIINIPSLGRDLPIEGAVKTHQVQELVHDIEGLPVYNMKYLDITGLPDEEPDTLIIVSAISLNAIRELLPHRKDCCGIYKAVKNVYGQTVGCAALRING